MPRARASRRDVLKLMGVGGVVFASGLAGAAQANKKKSSADSDFFFLQLSDTHWGYSGASNPEAGVTLKKVVETIPSHNDHLHVRIYPRGSSLSLPHPEQPWY